MPTANVPLWAFEGSGATKIRLNRIFGSGTWESLWHSLLGITRLGRLVAWGGDLMSVSLVLVRFVPTISLLTSAP